MKVVPRDLAWTRSRCSDANLRAQVSMWPSAPVWTDSDVNMNATQNTKQTHGTQYFLVFFEFKPSVNFPLLLAIDLAV